MFKLITLKDIAAATILILCLLLGNTAFAGDSQFANRFMDEFDENHDGIVSRIEYPGSDETFSRLDANGDGIISEAEVTSSTKRQKRTGGDFIERFDSNSDGKVSIDEFPGPEERFEQLDVNDDGYITADEAPAGSRKRGGGR